ncbi:MAG: hypothetical protein QW568_00280 [Candidatus Anstonellaceae archaeon]
MPKKDEPHRRTPVTSVKIRRLEEKKAIPVQTPDSVQRMEAAMKVASEHERNEPENAHPNVTHSTHANGVAGILYRAAAVVVGAIIAGVLTFVLPKIGLSQGKDTKPAIAMNDPKGAQGKLKVPENGEKKILGSENFEKVELRDGILYITNIKYAGRVQDLDINLRSIRKQIKEKLGEKAMTAFPEQIPLGIIGTQLKGDGVYLIFESGILWLSSEKTGIVGAADGSKIFLHEGAIYVAPNGSIVATTPTTLLIITSTYAKSFRYDSFEGAPNLTNPSFVQEKEGQTIYLTDASLVYDGKELVYSIQLKRDDFDLIIIEKPLTFGAR